MRFSMKDCKCYTSKAPPYINGLLFVQSGIEKKDVDCLLMKLRRMCDDNEGLSFLLITSTHKSKGNLQRKTIRTGKAGRPKTILQGAKAERHYHGLIINESKSTDIKEVKQELHRYCKKRREKRKNLKRQKITEAWSSNLSIVQYMERQADSVHRYGTFDFSYFENPMYLSVCESADNYDNILDFSK